MFENAVITKAKARLRRLVQTGEFFRVCDICKSEKSIYGNLQLLGKLEIEVQGEMIELDEFYCLGCSSKMARIANEIAKEENKNET